ncbi:hypothetical protein JST97_35305 [bacterium]|nr:hypothetical protein [bacterium]
MASRALLLLLMTWIVYPVWAQSDLKVQRRGSHVYVKISLRNPKPDWEGGFSMQCWARRTHLGPWLLLREWPRLPPLGPGQRLTRELFDQSSPTLRALAATGPVEVRSVIKAPGVFLKRERSLPVQSLRP